MSMSFLQSDGTIKQADGGTVWLPSLRQLRDAAQFQIGDALGPEIHEEQPVLIGSHTTMQQGLGLVIAVGVIAGALPFLLNLIRSSVAGTSLQMLAFAELATQRPQLWTLLGLDPLLMGDTFQQIAGMQPRLPGLFAGVLSALGGWINTPLFFLTLWIGYGAGVVAIAHFAGAKTILQRFFAATAYAFLPLALTTLTPIPLLGGLIEIIAWLGFILLYVRAVRIVSGLQTARAAIVTLLPGAIFFSLLIVAAGMLLGTLLVG